LELSGGNRLRIRRRSRIGAAVTLAAVVGAATLAGCGGSSSDEPSGTREVRVVNAEFPAKQGLGQTTLLQLGVRNESDQTIPGLTFTISVAGKAGEDSTLPFGVRDAQPGLAQPDRPVWVLSEGYPKLVDSSTTAGAEGAALKTYTFGPLKAGEDTEAVWKLSATRKGAYRLLFSVGATGDVKLETPDGAKPGGSVAATISPEVPDVTVNDKGEVVEIEEPKDATK
jgi:hypothetical protein